MCPQICLPYITLTSSRTCRAFSLLTNSTFLRVTGSMKGDTARQSPKKMAGACKGQVGDSRA